MISFLKNKAKNIFQKGHERTIKIKKNIAVSFFVRGGSALIGFLLIRVTLHYVNPLQYAIWLTVSSIVAWMNNFDIGLSNGLRNKLATALALGERDNMLKYVSTTYAALFIIAGLTFTVFFVAGAYVDWDKVLNVPAGVLGNTWMIIVTVLSCFCVQFILQPINTILTASHEVYKVSGISFIGQLLSLIVIYFLSLYGKGDLLTLVFVLAGVPVVVLFMANIFLFSTELKNLAPKLKYVDLKSARSLMSVGGVFFFLQMGSLIIYQTDNIIITRVVTPEAVTDFNIAYKLFTLLIVIAVIVMMPYWSAFTDAYAKNELSWIRTSLKRMRQAWLILSLVAAFLYIFSDFIYKLWLNSDTVIDHSLTLSMAVYVIAYIFLMIYTYFLNGTGKVRLELYAVFVSALVNIPLSIYWGRLYGLPGIVNANTAVTVAMCALFYIQSLKILNGTAVGIWNK